MRNSILLLGPLTALTLSACGGGGGSVSTGPLDSNAAPTITGLAANTTVLQDASSEPVGFTISDDATAAQSLEVSVSSSDEALMPVAGIQLSGNGESRSLLLVPEPGQSGTAQVTVSVKDAKGKVTTQQIALEVTSEQKSFRDFTLAQLNVSADGEPAEVAGADWVDTESDDPTAFDPVLSPIAE